jgi:hypothetical protein
VPDLQVAAFEELPGRSDSFGVSPAIDLAYADEIPGISGEIDTVVTHLRLSASQ